MGALVSGFIWGAKVMLAVGGFVLGFGLVAGCFNLAGEWLKSIVKKME